MIKELFIYQKIYELFASESQNCPFIISSKQFLQIKEFFERETGVAISIDEVYNQSPTKELLDIVGKIAEAIDFCSLDDTLSIRSEFIKSAIFYKKVFGSFIDKKEKHCEQL